MVPLALISKPRIGSLHILAKRLCPSLMRSKEKSFPTCHGLGFFVRLRRNPFLVFQKPASCFDWLQYHVLPLSMPPCVRLNFSSLRSLILSKQLAAAKSLALAIASSRSTFPRSAGSGLDIATYRMQSVA